MRILLDIIFNHSGFNWRYPPNEPGGADAPNYLPDGRYPFGAWRGDAGQNIAAIHGNEEGIWPAELQDPDHYTRAGSGDLGAGDIDDPHAEHKRSDFIVLRDFELDTPSHLSDLALCYKYWIALTDCDGFRIDTLKHVTLEQARNFCGSIKEFAANLGKENFFLVGEIAGGDYNENRYLDVLAQNLNAALDIGEMRLALTAVAKGLQSPSAYFDGFVPGNAVLGSHRMLGNKHVSILDDHDHVFGQKIRFSSEAASEHQVVAGVALQLFTLGIPCIYYGTEQAFAGPELSARQWLPDWKGSDRYLREAMFGPPHPRAHGRRRGEADPAQRVDRMLGLLVGGESGGRRLCPSSDQASGPTGRGATRPFGVGSDGAVGGQRLARPQRVAGLDRRVPGGDGRRLLDVAAEPFLRLREGLQAAREQGLAGREVSAHGVHGELLGPRPEFVYAGVGAEVVHAHVGVAALVDQAGGAGEQAGAGIAGSGHRRVI